jgi:zinc transporter ZupT
LPIDFQLVKMPQAQGTASAQPIDRSLMESSQILTKTFNRGRTDPDMDLLVNPQNSDLLMNKDKSHNKPFKHSHSLENSKENAKKLSNITPYLLLIALCLDGLFEGIAIGVQGTWKSVSFVAFAVILNKLSVAFGLGISLKKAHTEIKTFIRFIILFSMFCPFGIVLGYLLGEAIFMKGMFLAISAGTFTYVSCSVVIVEEFAITRHRFSKYSLFFLGGLLAAGISVVGAVL